uniref:PIR Superfamily Protein n=1 Tax=Strongyloides papillosus TaxID=174720 RepID=A0A0N5BGR9_STREA
MGGISSQETEETINIINDNMQAQGRNTMDSSDHMKHIYYGETLSLVTKIFAIVGLIGTIIFIIRCCIAYHKLQKRSSRSNHCKFNLFYLTSLLLSSNEELKDMVHQMRERFLELMEKIVLKI